MTSQIFTTPFLLAFCLSFIFSLFIIFLAKKMKILDIPQGGRKIHKKPIPLLGGTAIFLSFFLVLLIFKKYLSLGSLSANHWLGFFLGGLFLMVGGFLDDKYNLKPKFQLIFPVVAILFVLLGGIEIAKISNPFGGYIFLNLFNFKVSNVYGFSFYISPISDLFIVLWLMGMMYTTKLLDGMDGLVTGVVGIGAFIVFLFTMTTRYYQPDIGFASLVLAGACLGFLVLNWNPAKIFLGEGGSLFLGFSLGVLAIISGGKIAIALLVMGIPILDVFWTIIRRVKKGNNPFAISDRKHLHFRILDLGISQKRTVLFYYILSFVFGTSALFLQSSGKIMAISILILIMFIIVIGFNYYEKRQKL